MKTTTTVGLQHIDHINLSVTNLRETTGWYRRVFEFEQVEEGVYEGSPWAILRSGSAMLCLYEHPDWETLSGEERNQRRLHGVNHFALRISDRGAWEARVEQERLEVQYGGEVRWPHSGAWYVDDPTGNTIEVVLWDDDTIRFD